MIIMPDKTMLLLLLLLYMASTPCFITYKSLIHSIYLVLESGGPFGLIIGPPLFINAHLFLINALLLWITLIVKQHYHTYNAM